MVTLIMGFVGTIATIGYRSSQENARNAQMEANVRVVGMALEKYADENGGAYPTSLVSSGFLNGYVAGHKLPVSPWCKKPQTANIALTSSPPITSTYWDAVILANKLHNIPVGDANTMADADPPAAKTNKGALAYNNDAGVYHLMGYGFFDGHLAVLVPSSNNATGANARPN